MSEILNLGPVNGHIVGRVLKEAVRRATVVARNERAVFETHAKQGYDGTMTDVFTTADRKAQDIYLRTFNECFPNCGVIGEEDSLRKAPSNGCTAYFTVDPVDGTKAYVRRQSHGIATMVALVHGGAVVSAYIGDINTEEVYGYRPGSDRVFRITRLDTFEELVYRPPDEGSLPGMLRDPLDCYSDETQRMARRSFTSYESIGSSIGTWMARLWKREVAAAVLPAGTETPWDSTPLIGISQKLGYLFLRPSEQEWQEYAPALPLEPLERTHDTLIIHSNDLHLIR
jgi:fructose-1,6-bisphosphatase/inositol monophosphatase family enzyme